MKSDERKPVIGTLVFIAACAALAGLIAWGRLPETAPGGSQYLADYTLITGRPGGLSLAQRWAMALADGLMVVGVVVTGVGLMTWISTTGFFDTLGYGVSVLWDRITFKSRNRKFYDYKTARAEARKRTKPSRVIVLVGGSMLLLSLVCTALFYII